MMDYTKGMMERKALQKENADLRIKANSYRGNIVRAKSTIATNQKKIFDMEREISINNDRFYAIGQLIINQTP